MAKEERRQLRLQKWLGTWSSSEGRVLGLGSLVRRRQRGHLPGLWKGSDRHESKTPAASGSAAGITTLECSLGGPEVVFNNRKF